MRNQVHSEHLMMEARPYVMQETAEQYDHLVTANYNAAVSGYISHVGRPAGHHHQLKSAMMMTMMPSVHAGTLT